MKVLVTGSAGHLGEALVRTLRNRGDEVIGVDIQASPFTTHKGSIENAAFVKRISNGVDVIFHTATLHKPHVATHSEQDFIDTNITGTLNLLQAAIANGIKKFIFTSTTSVFGDALVPPPGMPAAWINEEVKTVPKNIYGVTKTAAEDLVSCSIEIRVYR
ncbi:NAD-dependent epimerase/dehydratase family protein [Pedobacter africanus]|uniref:NAD-dependent epimerase/dehydratase family protein n=1 Tax=Pedobacter africanus TaxID=151894 RepID=UPI00190EDC25|nr:NAD(P)-dependent oxidoreductase [Pedobacter africanus]